jgi:ankyrin repeat protein
MRRKIPAAIQAGDAEALRALLKEDPTAYALRTEQGHSFLLLALHYGRRDLAELLRGDASHLELHEAAAMGETARVRELLSAHPELTNAKSFDGQTPLDYAQRFGNLATADLIRAAGGWASPHQTTQS